MYSADKKILISFPAKKKCDSFNVPASVEHIGQALYGCSIKQVTLPDNVRTLGEFSLACGVSDIEMGKHLVSIRRSCLADSIWDMNGKSFSFRGYPNSVLPNYVTYLADLSMDINDKLEWSNLRPTTSLCNEFEVLSDGDDGLIILTVKSEDPSLVIPAAIGKYPVTGVHDSALEGKKIKSLTIASPNTSVNTQALSQLDEIVLPEGLQSIPDGAFSLYKLSSIIIPESVEVIGNNAFEGCTNLTSIAIPQGVKKIGKRAFYGCEQLKNIDIAEGVKAIGKEAFGACSSLISVLIPQSVETIGNRAFFDCSKLGNIDIPEGVEVLGNEAFEMCVSLTSIVIPQSVKIIGDRAFFNCHELENVDTFEGVIAIGNEAFKSCMSLSSIVIPQSVEKIGNGAFSFCYKLESIDIPESVEVIGNEAFMSCNNLTSVFVPGSVKVLSERVFARCRNLKSVALEEGIETIEKGVFYACTSLEKVIFPSSIRKIDENLFGNVDSFFRGIDMNPNTSYITVPGSFADTFLKPYHPGGSSELYLKELSAEDGHSNEPLETFNSFVYEPNGDGTVHVMLKSSVDVEEPNIIIPDSIGNKSVTELSFVSDSYRIRTSIESVEIPASVELIRALPESAFNTNDQVNFKNIFVAKDNAHYWSDGKALYSKDRTKLIHLFAYDLQEYELLDGVREVCDGAFAYQKKITRIMLPDSVNTIGDRAFYRCVNLTEIVGAEKVQLVGKRALDGTPYWSHTPIVIIGTVLMKDNGTKESILKVPEGVTEIAAKAFYSTNEKIVSVELPSTLKIIGENAFDGLKKLTEINIPNGVETIASKLFKYAKLKTIHIPASVNSIAFDAFPNSLERMTVDTANEIYVSEDGVLYSKDMKTLLRFPAKHPNTKVMLPDSLTSIAKAAFSHNSTIKSVVLPDSLSEIGQQAFDECTRLRSINLNGVKKIGDGAFYNCEALTDVSLSCKRIEASTFYHCRALVNVTLANTEKIEEGAFEECGIKLIELPSTLTEIEDGAFDNCHFASVTIPRTVTHVGDSAFYGAKHIYVYDTLQTDAGNMSCDYYGYGSSSIITVLSAEKDQIKYSIPMFSDGSRGHYDVLSDSWGPGTTFNFKQFDQYFDKIKGAGTKLRIATVMVQNPLGLSDMNRQIYESYVVRNAKQIMKSFIDANDPDSFSLFESFGTIKKANIDELIDYAANKQAVAFSAYLLDYKEKNFSAKKSVQTSLSLGNVRTVTPWRILRNTIGTVGRYRGFDLEVLFPTEVDGKIVTEIAGATATVPDNYKEIVSVVIPEGYVSIGDNAFRGCENLERISLPSTLKKLGKRAFMECSKLQEVVLPDAVVDIGGQCFEKCTSLQTIKLPLQAKKIDQGTFRNCSSLKSIELHKNIEYIAEECFHASGLKTVTFHDCDPWISQSAIDRGVVFIENKRSAEHENRVFTFRDIPSELLHKRFYHSNKLYYRYSFAAEGANSAYTLTPIEKIEFAGKSFMLARFHPIDVDRIKQLIVEGGGAVVPSDHYLYDLDYFIVNEDHQKTKKYYKVVFENSFGANVSIISLDTLKKLPNWQQSSSAIWLEKFGNYVETDPDIAYEKKRFVFSGLGTRDIENHKIVQSVIKKGGVFKSSVSATTDYLVVNPADAGESKINAAIKQQQNGKHVKVIWLNDLLSNLKNRSAKRKV